MDHIVKIFKFNGARLESEVMAYMLDWEEANNGHLHVHGVTALDVQLIGGSETQIWVTFEQQPMSDFERELLEASR